MKLRMRARSLALKLSPTVRNTGVPEPDAWALMILGLGGAGAALRRRGVATA
ncbi:MAG: PEPxxWA-CTERM sorting domain-containing protein [Pseudomonadota bacterium]